MITKRQYVEYLISTPANYTCSNLARHLDDVSHDAVTDYLQRDKLTAGHLWALARHLINDSEDACLIVDDSVQAKRHARKIEMVKRQYSGNEHGLVRGIGVVNLVHSDGEDYFPIDYRIYAPEADGKTKNDHFRAMVLNAKRDKQLPAQTILFDSWYAAWQNLKLIHRLDMVFVTTLKANRLVSLSSEQGYFHLQNIVWTPEQLQQGIIVKLKKVPFKVRLFKVVAPNGDIDWIITNDLSSTMTTQVIQDADDLRWHIEQLHRELKQLTGSEKCECRQQRSQRNHIACCYHAWLSLKVKAQHLEKSLYAMKHDLLYDYLRAELRDPRIPAYQPL
ncbi:MAG: transposase [Planctomycetaceae bacterium]|nr:transposase [Planctomycetaceae bacterium]